MAYAGMPETKCLMFQYSGETYMWGYQHIKVNH